MKHLGCYLLLLIIWDKSKQVLYIVDYFVLFNRYNILFSNVGSHVFLHKHLSMELQKYQSTKCSFNNYCGLYCFKHIVYLLWLMKYKFLVLLELSIYILQLFIQFRYLESSYISKYTNSVVICFSGSVVYLFIYYYFFS